MLEEILDNIKKKGLEKDFKLLEISTNDGIMRIPIKKIIGLAFVEE